MIVNFGCGAAPGPNCLNIDGSLTVLLARLPIPSKLFGVRAQFVTAIRDHNIKFATARRMRFAMASLDAFYTSHTLEHLERDECENLLRRVLDWLKPGGVLRVVLPDLKRHAGSYVAGHTNADIFLASLHLTAKSLWHATDLGYSRHRWMYDFESFASLLTRLGYQKICRASFGSSVLPGLGGLDVEVRRNESFYIEAIR
jgi:SAM-dependent methyltransferase